MTDYPYTLALILPASDADDGNKLAWALGRQPDPQQASAQTFTAPLSGDGTEPASHYGALSQATDEGFVGMLQDAKQDGTLPSIDWSTYGLTATRVAEVLNAMTYAIGENKPGNAQAVMDDAMAQAGVQRVQVTDDI